MFYDCKIQAIRNTEQGAVLQILAPGIKMSDLIKQKIKSGELRLDDGRRISSEQRKKAYASINDIAEQTYHDQTFLKEYFKYYLMSRKDIEYFSLSDCSMTIAREYINLIIEYCLDFGIQLTDLALNRTDDINTYLFKSIEYKTCCICGREGEIHHVDAIGMGRDRTTYNDSKHRKICLCRKHHTEVHKVGWETFKDKYHVYGIEVQN